MVSVIRRKLGKISGGMIAALLLLVSVAVWAAPPAGTIIGNQASATYTDGSGTTRTVTSNTVNTVVQQVASLTMASNGSRTVTPGGTVTFPHTITNTGNGSDSFSLAAANVAVGDNYDFASFSIYADSNGDGVPDNTTNIAATPSIAAGSSFSIVVSATLPGGVVATDIGLFDITATSVFDAGQSATNQDTATVTGNAVISMTKSIDVSSGAAGSTGYTYTFTYTNTGNNTASNVTLADTIPAGMTYVASSGRWSLTGATVLTDANAADAQGTAPDTIIYDYNVTTASTVTFVLNRVLPGQSGSFSFQVDINAGVAPGIISNTGSLSYNDGAAAVGPFTTNAVAFTVTQTAGVTVGNDTVAAANQGATFSFTNLVTNTGNGTDSFDMSLSGSTFPAGTSFQFYQADGVTPLLDTNGNGTPDTGNVAAAGTYSVVTQVTLPPAATGGPFTVNVNGTSFFNSATTAAGTATLTAITAASVDLDDTTPAVNTGDGNTVNPTIIATDPGNTVTFTLFVNNTGGIGDTYDLSVAGLPAGWSAVFKDTGNTVITNTGLIAAGGNMQIAAEVTVPAGYAAGNVALTFSSTSPSTAATDSYPGQVNVNTVYNVINSPNNTGQVFSGSAVTYSHTITNGSNVAETAIALSVANDQTGWSAAIYLDDGTTPGVLDAADSSYAAPLNLPVGSSQVILVKVFAPAGVTAGVINTTTLSATGLSAVAVDATDSTTVISGNIQLLKEQALDAACDGTADTAYGIGNVNANPGECVMYQITATNVGAATASSIVVNDSTPPFTTYNATGGAAATTVGAMGSVPADGTAGLVSANVGNLTSGQFAVITFKVRIDP